MVYTDRTHPITLSSVPGKSRRSESNATLITVRLIDTTSALSADEIHAREVRVLLIRTPVQTVHSAPPRRRTTRPMSLGISAARWIVPCREAIDDRRETGHLTFESIEL